MKFVDSSRKGQGAGSLPSRERGLKCCTSRGREECRIVAPFTGAWIEIRVLALGGPKHPVAPFTGAWIEIDSEWQYQTRCASLPSRERGLKFEDPKPVKRLHESLPSRERGLKCESWRTLHAGGQSLPSRERGLKSFESVSHLVVGHVAPFTGAWIEIHCSVSADRAMVVAPFTGAWIEIVRGAGQGADLRSLPSRERGLKCEADEVALAVIHVAPFTGAWIEMPG